MVWKQHWKYVFSNKFSQNTNNDQYLTRGQLSSINRLSRSIQNHSPTISQPCFIDFDICFCLWTWYTNQKIDTNPINIYFSIQFVVCFGPLHMKTWFAGSGWMQVVSGFNLHGRVLECQNMIIHVFCPKQLCELTHCRTPINQFAWPCDHIPPNCLKQ